MPALERPASKVGIVDLSTGQVTTVPVPLETSRQYVGGRGVGVRLLHDNLKPATDPLGPASVIVLSAGLLDGLLAPAASVTDIVAASPDGGLAGVSLGGFFGPELRWAGLDHIVILGRAPRPAWLLARDGQVELHDAGTLSGKSAGETQEWLRQELADDAVQCLGIGPAGEARVCSASIVAGHENPGGQRGLGAVFGAKNLKAVAARGTGGLRVSFPEAALDYEQEMVRRIRASQAGRQLESAGALYFDRPPAAAAMADYVIGRSGCFACQLRCRYRYLLKEGTLAGAFGETADCATRAAWEALLGADRLAGVLAVNHRLKLYGLDLLGTADLVGWAMSLYQRGVLTERETGGLELEPGNENAVLELIAQIGRRAGLGDVLAAGRARAAVQIGSGADRDRGLPAVAMNAAQSLDLAAAVRHPGYLFALPPAAEESLATAAYERSLCSMAAGMLGVCDLQTAVLGPDLPGFAEFSRMVYLNTGRELPAERLRECAERAVALERLLTQRLGAPSAAPEPPGLAEYYRLAGWDERGVPRPETLQRLGLGSGR